MKTDIQERMDSRISEIRTQNTMFDNAITAVETEMSETMNADSSTRYSLRTDTWEIIVMLDESLTDGVVTIAVNRILIGGNPRYATMTVTSKAVVNESYNNIDSVEHRTTIVGLFAAIFETVRGTINNSQE